MSVFAHFLFSLFDFASAAACVHWVHDFGGPIPLHTHIHTLPGLREADFCGSVRR